MFHDWKVGKQGWVRLRNGKVARAIQFGHDSRPVQIQFMKGDELSWTWVENSGLGSETSAISHLPDCTGFDWEPKFKVGDWVRIISHERWCDDAKKDHPIGSYRKIATISFMSRELKLETASRWKFFMFDHFEPFVYRVGDWVQVNTTNSRDLEHPQGAIRRIRAIEQRGFGKFFFFDGFNFGVFDTDVIPIDQLPSIIWQLSAKVGVVSR